VGKGDDRLFEDAMTDLDVRAETEAAEGTRQLAESLADIAVERVEPSEAVAFDQAMATLDVGPEHREEDAPPVPADRRSEGRRSLERAIRRGRLTPDFTLDLHGLTRAQAWVALERCVHAARRDGHRVLRVICGRGLHSHGPAVLLEALQEWLRGPLAEHVVASYPSAPSDGGRGAWFLLLRGP